jgi:hypothetical protein
MLSVGGSIIQSKSLNNDNKIIAKEVIEYLISVRSGKNIDNVDTSKLPTKSLAFINIFKNKYTKLSNAYTEYGESTKNLDFTIKKISNVNQIPADFLLIKSRINILESASINYYETMANELKIVGIDKNEFLIGFIRGWEKTVKEAYPLFKKYIKIQKETIALMEEVYKLSINSNTEYNKNLNQIIFEKNKNVELWNELMIKINKKSLIESEIILEMRKNDNESIKKISDLSDIIN